MNTVRKYYRNATLAFPHTTEYACSITRPPLRFADKCVAWTLFFGGVAAALSVAFVGPAV